MCGRAANSLAPEDIMQLAGVGADQWQDMGKYQPTFNVSPGKYQPVLISTCNGHKLISMKWGLFSTLSPSNKRPINARCETLTTKPMFKQLVKSKRCVVFMQGYYEWTTSPKQAYFVKLADDKVIYLAALFDSWLNQETGELLYTYTVITTESNPKLLWLHDRMPVILNEEEKLLWLSSNNLRDVLPLLRAFTGPLEAYPVSNDVGKVSNDGEYLTHKIELKQERDIRSFFSPKKEEKEEEVKKEAIVLQKPVASPKKGDIRSFFTPKTTADPVKIETPGSPKRTASQREDIEEQPSKKLKVKHEPDTK